MVIVSVGLGVDVDVLARMWICSHVCVRGREEKTGRERERERGRKREREVEREEESAGGRERVCCNCVSMDHHVCVFGRACVRTIGSGSAFTRLGGFGEARG